MTDPARPPRRSLPARTTDATPLTHLGRLPVAGFMRRHWQRTPLLVRGAFADFASPVDAAALRALAARPDVESRLVSHRADRRGGTRWTLAHGPFGIDGAPALPAPRRTNWTVLVQNVDAHDAATAALRRRFRFIPDARLDDVMVSLAGPGGGVGPHVDSYDVFLIQGSGRRRWRWSPPPRRGAPEPQWVPELPLRILAAFEPVHEAVLRPGDLLYLPPGAPHEGVALDAECITLSVGFRAPRWRDIAELWLDEALAGDAIARRYADPGRPVTRRPAELPADLTEATLRALRRLTPTRAEVERALLAWLSEPRPDVQFDAPARPPGAAAFARAARARGVVLDLRSRLIHRGRTFGFNGEVQALPPATARLFAQLAARGSLSAHELADADAAALGALHAAVCAGYANVAPGP